MEGHLYTTEHRIVTLVERREENPSIAKRCGAASMQQKCRCIDSFYQMLCASLFLRLAIGSAQLHIFEFMFDLTNTHQLKAISVSLQTQDTNTLATHV